MSDGVGRWLISRNDDRAVRWARRTDRSPTQAPLFDPVDRLGHWLDVKRRMRKARR